MSDVAISLKNVSKTFYLYEDQKMTLRSLISSFFNQGKTRKFEALKDIDFDIKKGEFFGIVGRNGSGKSTLLKIIAGIYEADKGSKVEVHGRLVPFLELGVGFNTDLSGKENIFLNGTILGMTRKYIEEHFDEIVDFAELRDFIDTPVKNYSSGMILRLAFAIAIQSKADVYILDEILSVGDALFQQKSLQTINRLKKEGKTIIFVSHNMGDIKKYCNRAVLIDKSHIVALGDPSEIIDKYKEVNEQRAREIFASNNSVNSALGSVKNYKIKEVKMFDDQENEIYTFSTGDEIKIQLDVDILEKADILNCDIGIHSIEDSTLVSAVNTFRDEQDVNPGANYISVKINDLRLNDGEYYLGCTLFGNNPGDVYHVMPFALKFKVDNQKKWPGGGRVQFRYEWEIK